MSSLRRVLFSCHPSRYLIFVIAFSCTLLWFSEFDDFNVRKSGFQGQPDHDHVHHITKQSSFSSDFIEIRNVKVTSSNKKSDVKKFNVAKKLCNQANDTCLGLLESRSRDVYSLVTSPARIKKGTYTLYVKTKKAGEISFERNFVECAIPKNDSLSQSNGCRLPNLDPWDDSIKQYIERLDPMTCEGTLYTSYNNNVIKYEKPRDPSRIKRITYQSIWRPPETDDGLLYGDETTLTLDGKGTKLTDDFVQVNTYLANDEIQMDFHAQAAPKKEVLERKSKHQGSGIPLNIIILGLDGNSHANFQRFLPETYKFLKEDLKAFIFEGFSALGEATTPQLTGLLTGKTLEKNCEVHEARKGISVETVDKWPFIFKTLKDHGYATMFSEDAPNIGAFSLRLNGFRDQPTDHYGRYFWSALPPDDIGTHANCINLQPQHVMQLNYLKSYIEAYPKTAKFAFTFLANLCHQSFNLVSSGSQDIYNFLKSFKQEGHLNNTMLVIMGDHGARFDEIRSTLQGKLEERLPFLSISLPEWFRLKYPSLTKNLEANTKRIISPLDVHATFMHILKFPKNPSRSSLTQGSSLFESLPKTRECKDAHIPTHFCPCIQFRSIPIHNNPHIQIGAFLTIQHINNLLNKNVKTSRMCHKLVLSDIMSAVQAMPNKNVQRFNGIEGGMGLGVGKPIFNEEKDIQCTYEIQLRTRPNMAIYESTIKFVDGKFTVHGEISRVNRYGTQSFCITKTFPYLRKFCLCGH